MIRNFIWDFAGKISGQVFAFVISVILTRLLQPEEYGIMGMAMVIISVANAFLGLGFSAALVQQKEVTPLQQSTVFYLNLLIGGVLFLACFGGAGYVADFYDQPAVRDIFRALSFLFLVNAAGILPGALLYRQMKFKAITLIAMVSTLLSGIAGIVMAYRGYGVWSLVVQSLAGGVLSLLITEAYVRYVPLLRFRLSAVSSLWRFGRNMFASGLLDNIFSRLDVFIIGKIFTPATLGFYTRAQTMDLFVRQFSSGSITSVLFPHIARNQDDREMVRALFIKYVQVILLISLFLGGLLFVTARDLFVFLFSERWAYSGYLFQYMALAVFVWPVSSIMCAIIAGLGDSGAFLRLEVYKKLLLLPVYGFGFFWGIEVFVKILVLYYYVALLLNAWFLSRQISLTVADQLQTIGKYLLGAMLTVGACYSLSWLWSDSVSVFWRLALSSSLFTGVYLTMAHVSGLPAWRIILHKGLSFIKTTT